METCFVSIEQRAYGAFKDRNGEEVPAGVTWWLATVESPGQAVEVVKVTRELGQLVASMGLQTGDRVEVDRTFVPGRNGAFYARVHSVHLVGEALRAVGGE